MADGKLRAVAVALALGATMAQPASAAPLHDAARANIKAAAVNAEARKGIKPLDVADHFGHAVMKALLREHGAR